MTEAESSEVERVLLHAGRACDRARRAAAALAKAGAEPNVVEALERTSEELSASYRRLTQATYYAVGEDELRLVVRRARRVSGDLLRPRWRRR